ncbi:MAG: hypothetical protein H7A48_02280 [Akkermansiaceae bacterium]|nr:hypothetical protein [Akkermansiaceae bacterium]
MSDRCQFWMVSHRKAVMIRFTLNPEMEARTSVIEYSPGAGNSYGHAAVPRNLAKLVPCLRAFLRDFTMPCDFSPSLGPENALNMVVHGFSKVEPAGLVAAYEERVRRFLESRTMAGEMPREPREGPDARLNQCWPLDGADFERALDFMVEEHPWPKCWWNGGPVALEFGYWFTWRDPRTGEAFPGQETGFFTED